jgi:alpha-L-fucosidase 2
MADTARSYLVNRVNNKNIDSKFPAFWGPNYDWKPDQTHGGVIMQTLQSMLMQTDGKKIYLLPAFPKDWNANFKLHAPFNTTIQGKVTNNKIIDLKVKPEYRKKDIVIVGR